MILDNKIYEVGLVRYLLENGAEIAPLELTGVSGRDILASMNPSIFIDGDVAYANIRGVNYNLFSNGNLVDFSMENQPITYVSKDIYHLKTTNFMANIDLDSLELSGLSMVDTSLLDKEPLWDFVGLEDARIVSWPYGGEKHMYLCGVRRDDDTTKTGIGRMNLSEIELIDGRWVEVKRIKIPAAGDDKAYCEKNWIPIIDKPFTWLKWANPIEIARYDIETNKLDVDFKRYYDESKMKPYRGDSHIVMHDGHYWCIMHDCDFRLLDKSTNARCCTYGHYVIELDEDLNVADVSGKWNYSNDFDIEFGCGLAIRDGYAYISYAEDDSAAYIIKFKADLLFKPR